MADGNVTVAGTTPKDIPFNSTNKPTVGLRILGRAAGAGKLFWGSSATVSSTTGSLLPCGDPATSIPKTIPPEHFQLTTGKIYVVASDGSNYTVDWDGW